MFSTIKAPFILDSSSLHQCCSAKDGSIVIGQLGNANVNAAVVNEAQMLLKRLASGFQQHFTSLNGTAHQEDGFGTAESHCISHGDAQPIARLFKDLDGQRT